MYGFEKFLTDLALEPQMPCDVMEHINERHTSSLQQVLQLTTNRIDMVYSYDDLTGQEGLLISRDMWLNLVGSRRKQLFDLAKKFDKPIMYHCCGNIASIIPDLIDIGVNILNPIQPLAIKMSFEELKNQFGKHLTFHRGIDVQDLLPHGKPDQVKTTVEDAVTILGSNGGYILAPAHHIQADTPIENILALYGLD